MSTVGIIASRAMRREVSVHFSQHMEALMRNLIMAAFAVFGTIFLIGGSLTAPAEAGQCHRTLFRANPCPVVPEMSYKGGGVDIVVVPATACFTPQVARIITRPNGSNEWTADFVYNPDRGSHEVIKTMHNAVCWSHNVAVGTWMAVYVTCREYTGWVAARITGPGRYIMVPVPWRFRERLG